jgi:hypothetical protein
MDGDGGGDEWWVFGVGGEDACQEIKFLKMWAMGFYLSL